MTVDEVVEVVAHQMASIDGQVLRSLERILPVPPVYVTPAMLDGLYDAPACATTGRRAVAGCYLIVAVDYGDAPYWVPVYCGKAKYLGQRMREHHRGVSGVEAQWEHLIANDCPELGSTSWFYLAWPGEQRAEWEHILWSTLRPVLNRAEP